MSDTAAVVAAAAVVGGSVGASVVAIAGLSPWSQMFGQTLIAGNDPNEVALTYDDGPNVACTPALLDLLAWYDVKATFFMLGGFAREQKVLARRVLDAGHVVGNHTMTHPWLVLRGRRAIREELAGCKAALEDVLGAEVKYFRPPHGARTPYVLQTAHELGMTTVQWNAMGKDWLPIGPEQVVQNVRLGLRRARGKGRGGNVLLHDGDFVRMGADRRRSLEATEMLLDSFVREGVRVVTVDAWDTEVFHSR
jgi:peptidoglycan/xylan/chitin deacetylase (PgdA/CDA1 family)